jgi:hypothetical protein
MNKQLIRCKEESWPASIHGHNASDGKIVIGKLSVTERPLSRLSREFFRAARRVLRMRSIIMRKADECVVLPGRRGMHARPERHRHHV